MYCTQCGTEVKIIDNFCSSCGSPTTKKSFSPGKESSQRLFLDDEILSKYPVKFEVNHESEINMHLPVILEVDVPIKIANEIKKDWRMREKYKVLDLPNNYQKILSLNSSDHYYIFEKIIEYLDNDVINLKKRIDEHFVGARNRNGRFEIYITIVDIEYVGGIIKKLWIGVDLTRVKKFSRASSKIEDYFSLHYYKEIIDLARTRYGLPLILKLRGVTFDNRQENISKINSRLFNKAFVIIDEDINKGVKIYSNDYGDLGFVPKEFSPIIREASLFYNLEARILEVIGGGEITFGVKVVIYTDFLYDEMYQSTGMKDIDWDDRYYPEHDETNEKHSERDEADEYEYPEWDEADEYLD